MSGNTFREISADGENSNSNYLSLRDELFGLIESWRNDLAPEIDEHTSLVASGVIDSLSLLNLFLWIEGKIGHSIDPMEVNVARELDCVANILQFILCAGGTHEGARAAQTFAGAPLSSPSDYRIVKFNPEYRRLVADFQTGLWSPDPDLNLRYLTWKYDANPYANQSRIYLVFHNDDLVGMRGFYASRWEVGVPTRAFPVLVADDFLIRADHRNRGLGNEIMRAAYDDLRDTGPRFLFNLSGSKLTVLGALTTGWRSIGALKPMGRRSFSGRLFPVLRRQLSRIPYSATIRAFPNMLWQDRIISLCSTRPQPDAA